MKSLELNNILNEMLVQDEDFGNLKGDIFFILHDEEAKKQVTLRRALEAFPNVKIMYDDFKDNVNILEEAVISCVWFFAS